MLSHSSRFPFLGSLAFLLFSLVSLRHCPADDRPNIILVMADDMGWAQTGYRNHPVLKTPQLDLMAENGIRFENFYAGAPVCSPTRATVLTGRTNDRTGVQNHGYALRLQENTIAGVLADSGYSTAHFGKWHLSGLRGPGVPIFASNDHHPGNFGFQTWLSVTNFFDRDPTLSRMGEFEEKQGDSSEVVVAEALDFVRGRLDEDSPFFVVIWFGSPHNPFRAIPADNDSFEQLDPESRDHYGELVAMDRSIGTLRTGLRDLDVADNTLFWFCSDNGGLPKIKPSTVAPLKGNKGTIDEGGLKVPAIIQWPDKIKQPAIVQHRAGTVDIYPTLLEITGAAEPDPSIPRDGISLLPMISRVTRGEDAGVRPEPILFRHQGRLAMIDGDLKLVAKNYPGGPLELYDLKSDPTESTDLSSQRPDVVAAMKAKMVQWNQSVVRSVEGKDYPLGRVADGEPESRFWTTEPTYQQYFDQWVDRPEYSRWIKREQDKSNTQRKKARKSK